MALIPAERQIEQDSQAIVRIRLGAMELHRPRQWGGCWLACELYNQLELDQFFSQRIPPSRQLLGVMPEQNVEDPLLKSFSVKLPLLVNLVLAALGPQASQTLEVTPRSELGTQLGRLRATGKRHPASGAASLGIPAIGQQVKMPQNPLDDAAVFDEGDDFHLGPAIEPGQGVGFSYLRNEPGATGRRWADDPVRAVPRRPGPVPAPVFQLCGGDHQSEYTRTGPPTSFSGGPPPVLLNKPEPTVPWVKMYS